jgi:hypothetical protein
VCESLVFSQNWNGSRNGITRGLLSAQLLIVKDFSMTGRDTMKSCKGLDGYGLLEV